MKTYSKNIKLRARQFRNKGWTLGEIHLKMDIPKNTLSGWVKDIRLTNEQKERILRKIITFGAIGRQLAVEVNRNKITRWKARIRRNAEHCVKLTGKNPKIGRLICGILYLCEGAKYPSSQVMTFGNSDPEMIRLFLGLLRKDFNIREEKLRCRIMPRWDQDITELQNFWSKVTGIPTSRFYRTRPDLRTKGKKTIKQNYKGVCAVQYCDTSLQFELQAIGEALMRRSI